MVAALRLKKVVVPSQAMVTAEGRPRQPFTQISQLTQGKIPYRIRQLAYTSFTRPACHPMHESAATIVKKVS
jgi:hypothetical protein